MARATAILACFLFTFAGRSTAQLVWESTSGPKAGVVNAIITSNGNVFAGTAYGGIFQSADLGESWSRLDATSLFEGVQGFASNAEGHLFAVSNKGVRRSIDGGATWENVARGLTSPNVRSIAINSSGIVFVGTASAGANRSEDNGVNYVAINNGLTGQFVRSLAVDKDDRLYAATDMGVFVTEDDGENWTDISQGLLGLSTWEIYVDANGVVWVGASAGVHTKAGESDEFERIDNRFADAFVTTPAGTFLAGTSQVLRSNDGGSTWSEASLVSEGFIQILDFAALDAATVFAATSQRGVFRSDDDGASWQIKNEGLIASEVLSLEADENGQLFAGCGQGVFRSDDGGATWEMSNDGLESGAIEALMRTTSGTLLAGVRSRGIFRSSDSGTSWSPSEPNIATNGAWSFSEAQNGDLFAGGWKETIYRSTDGGVSWDTVDTGSNPSAVFGLGTSPTGTILAGSQHGIRRSTDGGETWEDANTGLAESNPNIYDFEFLPNGDILAAAFHGVFRSKDDGLTWEATGQVPVNGLRDVEADAEGKIYITMRGGGVAVSEDDAASWTSLNSGLRNLDATALVAAPLSGKNSDALSADVLFVGTRGDGVLRLASVATGISDEVPESQRGIAIGQNFPNPFSGTTRIPITLDRAAHVSVAVYDVLGREVLRRDFPRLVAGESNLALDAASLAPSSYFYHVELNGKSVRRGMLSITR